jgi:peptidoglycan/xylan/chitin deacetylase (PgdA/CDA1 family)
LAVIPSKREGASRGLILFVGFIIVFTALLIFLFVIRTVHGKFSASQLVPDSNVLQSLLPGQDANIAILHSDYTRTVMGENNKWLNENTAVWSKILNNNNNTFETISDEDIESGNHFKYELVILAGSLSLSDLQIFQIKKYLAEGGSIFATSGTASYSEDGKWRGWDFFSEVFGVNYSKEIGREDAAKVHKLRGGIPITSNIPTGFLFEVDNRNKPIVVEVFDPVTKQISFWYNHRLEDGLVTGGIKKTAGMVYGKYGEGRFIWMGFDVNSVIGINEDNIYINRLFYNCITWLKKEPIGFIKDWPFGYNAAAILAPTLNGNTHNIKNLLPILIEENIQVTFFVEPNYAANHKDLIKTISGFGEIASLIDIGYLTSVNDTVNRLDDYDTQFDRLTFAKQVLSSITQKKITGFLPYYGFMDENTINAVINAGYNCILVDSLTDRSVPKTITRNGTRILAMSQTARDDYEVIRNFGITQSTYQFYTYQEDINRVMFEGGLYLFKMHTDSQCDEKNVGVVKDVINELKEKKFWITTSEEVQNWFLIKDNLEIRTEQTGSSRVAVTISNPGGYVASNVIIQVDLNIEADNISIESEAIGKKSAAFSHQRGSEIINLYINHLQPNETRTIYIDIDQILS